MNNNVIRVYRTDPVNTNGMNGIVGNTMPLQQEVPFRNLTGRRTAIEDITGTTNSAIPRPHSSTCTAARAHWRAYG